MVGWQRPTLLDRIDMSTYKVMQDRIADELVRTDLTSQIKLAILSAIEDLKGDRFARVNDVTFTLNTVANQSFYDLSTALLDENGAALPTGTTMIEADSVVCNFNNWFQPLVPKSVGWMDVYQIPTFTGQPYFYGFIGEKIRLAPTPNAVYSVTIRGHVEWPALVNDADTNLWMTKGEKLTRGTALTILGRDTLRDPLVSEAGKEAAGEARRAHDRQNAARSTNRLSSWGA